MGALIDILIDFGYWGMLAAAFLAGSFFPFSSEAVMTALVAVGLDPYSSPFMPPLAMWPGDCLIMV